MKTENKSVETGAPREALGKEPLGKAFSKGRLSWSSWRSFAKLPNNRPPFKNVEDYPLPWEGKNVFSRAKKLEKGSLSKVDTNPDSRVWVVGGGGEGLTREGEEMIVQ